MLFVNGKPVFADIEESTYGLDPKSVKEKYNPSVKAIVPIDYAGLSCKIHELKDFAKENNCILIEDAAEALGSTVNGSKVGSIADSSVFSFCGNKVLTTGEGGAIVTDSKEIFENAFNRIWALPNYSRGPGLLTSSGIINLQNNQFHE